MPATEGLRADDAPAHLADSSPDESEVFSSLLVGLLAFLLAVAVLPWPRHHR